MTTDEFEDPALARKLDQTCDRFESDWKSGHNPRMADYLPPQDDPHRTDQLRQLLLIEWELKATAEQTLELADYVAAFPQDHSVIHDAWEIFSKDLQKTHLGANDSPTWDRDREPTETVTTLDTLDTPETLGRYRVRRSLGRGAFGCVFLAHDERLRRDVAVKVPSHDILKHTQDADAFIAEARTLAELDHPNIVPVYDVGTTEEYPCFVVSKFMDGTDLAQHLRAGIPDHDRSADLVACIAEALQFAHAKKIIHRDIKPANILLDSAGRPHLADFGLALNEQQYGQRQGLVGTPSYMSPEQVSRDGHFVDGRSDIFSLGVVFYELLTGERPFTAPNVTSLLERIAQVEARPPRQLNSSIPHELERICLKALSKRAVDRYTAAGDMAAELRAWLTDNGDEEMSPTPTSPPYNITTSRAPTAEEIRSSDIVISSAELDNQSLGQYDVGWVARFEHNLKVRMEQLLGEHIQVASLPMPAHAPTVDDTLMESLASAKTLVSVLSPPFTKSPGCLESVKQFWNSAEENGSLTIEDKPRIFKVLKSPVPNEDVPNELSQLFSRLFGFEFFEQDPETGRIREFDELLGSTMKQRFHERVYDLAHDVSQLLRAYRRVGDHSEKANLPAEEGPVVYLATTTTDVQDERDRIRRELIERGCVVVPDGALPLSAQELERFVQNCLKRCTMAVHIMGRHYGVTPEDADESLPAMQLRMTSRHADKATLRRLLWMPPVAEVTNARQAEFLCHVQESPALHRNAELIEGELSLLKSILIRRLSEPDEQPSQVASEPKDRPPQIYLICERRDEDRVAALEDYLFEQGLDVALPAFDGSDEDGAALHRENLLTCDALMVYYGTAPRAWVDIKLRDVLKTTGYGRRQAIATQSVFIAPPHDRRKERFKSRQAEVIRATDDFENNQALNHFVEAIRKASGRPS